jgi:hypothetical protein
MDNFFEADNFTQSNQPETKQMKPFNINMTMTSQREHRLDTVLDNDTQKQHLDN